MSEQNDAARPKKRAKRKNALKHGVYSREVMFPGENIRDYNALASEFMEEWAPEGPTERGLVERLLGLYWRKQRLDRYEQEQLHRGVQRIHENNEASRMIEEMKDWAPKFQDAASAEEVDEILAELDDAYSDFIKDKVPYDESPDAPPRGPAIAKFLASLQPPARLEGPAKFIALVNPTFIQVEMARSDRIDEAIDRTVKRLMQVKTAKQILPNMRKAIATPKLISVPALTGPSPQANENEQSFVLLEKVAILAEQDVVGAKHT
jgi:hypothetical protein